MLRRLFRTLSFLVTIALAALTALWLVLWVASYWRSPRLSVGYVRGASGTGLDFRTTPGAFECVGTTGEVPPPVPEGFSVRGTAERWQPVANMTRQSEWVRAGFGAHRWREATAIGRRPSRRPAPNRDYFGASLPFWFLAAACGTLPVLRWNPRRLRRQRLAAGLCPRCGYDLRATPGRCPECGTSVAGKEA